jgi:uncharacterized protein
VTIDSISDYHTGDETIESFATHLFNTWGIGDSQRNDGVLILIAVKDRKVRIEVGSGYGSTQDANMQEVINEYMLPFFKRNDYSQGIYQGARAVVGTLTGIWPSDLGSPTPESTRAVTPSQSQSSANNIYIPVVILGAIAALGAAAFGLQQYVRHRKRRCPNCQTYMTCLPENDEGMYLDYGQKHEKIFDSVDYDVWKCPNCGRHTVYRYKRWLSHHRRDSSSWWQRGKPPSERSSTSGSFYGSSSDSTYSSSSSDSSSSSFGGGHSSGDGASGNW